MSSYSKHLDEYLTTSEKSSLITDYNNVNDSSFEYKNQIIGEFYQTYL
jgi:hypothetical protein